MPYTLSEHRHRFAAWAASRAASVKGCGFKVKQGVAILELSGFDSDFDCPSKLPEPSNFDSFHKSKRDELKEKASDLLLPFTDGVAAKLINCYLKAKFVCGGHSDDEKVKALHPPIDDVLLESLIYSEEPHISAHAAKWRKLRKTRWSKFSSEEYQDAIDTIRESLGHAKPLWTIEEFWKGYQK